MLHFSYQTEFALHQSGCHAVTFQNKTSVSLYCCQILKTALHVKRVDSTWLFAAQLMEGFSVHAVVCLILVNCSCAGVGVLHHPA